MSNYKYESEYKRLGVQPIIKDFDSADRGEIMDNMKRNRDYQDLTKKRADVKIITDDSEMPPIKLSPNMAPANAGMWYDNEKIDPNKAIDNNVRVDLEPLQIDNPDSIVSKIIKQYAKPEPTQSEGKNFVLLLKRKPVLIGNLDEIREKAKDMILQLEGLQDDDIMVFMRIPLDKIFG